MRVHCSLLSATALQAVIADYVTRDGTDHTAVDCRIAAVIAQLKAGMPSCISTTKRSRATSFGGGEPSPPEVAGRRALLALQMIPRLPDPMSHTATPRGAAAA